MNLLLNLFGAAQLGIVLNSWMVGLICVQGYNYYLHFPRDKMVIKLLVAWVVHELRRHSGLQVFNLLVQTVMIYHYLVVSFGDYDRLANVAWEWAVYLGLISFAACSVQLFYAHLSGRNYLIYGVIHSLDSWLVQAWLCVDGACDLLIAVFQVYYLYRGRGELVNLDARRKASLMTGGVVLMDSSSRTTASVSHAGGAVSGEQWPVKMNPSFDEKTTTQFSTTIHSSDSGAIETVVLTHLDDNSTNYFRREE
ncbi:hypothetical protein GALMADRAFT_1334012 [Galerina marginata CBS 339.88]|uniref:Uncharacterized protein n=1 Tax=Galerina marginata (strain CBS 339.88) TaxID=685588 RepID=A0A067T404_GALM3|nr:hypothetical protein GALMADRAFT_1334012 [Galerina marginata CBS 339.88]